MIARRAIAAIVTGVLGIAGAMVAPAFGATEQTRSVRAAPSTPSRISGSFTPAAADPRLAAAFARSGLDVDGFRFTPAESRSDKRAVTVAVRARSTTNSATSFAASRIASSSNTTTVGMAPIAYNLGVSVGWKRFAVSGNVAKIDLAAQPGSREAADLAVSYRTGRISSRLAAAADRPLASATTLVGEVPSYSVDMSSSYSLTRNLDVTAGLRYKSERERLAQLKDDRRDSQAVYVGTAFHF